MFGKCGSPRGVSMVTDSTVTGSTHVSRVRVTKASGSARPPGYGITGPDNPPAQMKQRSVARGSLPSDAQPHSAALSRTQPLSPARWVAATVAVGPS